MKKLECIYELTKSINEFKNHYIHINFTTILVKRELRKELLNSHK